MNTQPIIYALIPARGGSKGIPRKNVKSFAGKPLIAHTIGAALGTSSVSRVFVSTDDTEIADVAKEYGAEVPFMRPVIHAGDTTPMIDVVVHFAKSLEGLNIPTPDYIILLQATSPLRNSQHIEEALALVRESGTDSVIGLSLAKAHEHPAWAFKENEDGTITLWDGTPVKDIVRRRQDLPKAFRSNGMIFAFKTNLVLADEPSLYGEVCRGYMIEEKFAVDIDAPEDWAEAEAKYNALNS